MTTTPPPPPPPRIVRVLVVDDQPLMRSGFSMMLSAEEDIEVVGDAADGAAAIEACRQLRPDVVLMDVQMPGMDGRQTTEAIRQWESSHGQAALPIIALTAHALANEKRALLQTGMDDYLTKPIT
ncbi:response regulator, partial [Acinetobacter baumannii]|uniref:response regulator n=1 Tax=Acinetobacter baumannii TaxID=470 RepID=UPI003F6873CF